MTVPFEHGTGVLAGGTSLLAGEHWACVSAAKRPTTTAGLERLAGQLSDRPESPDLSGP